MSCQNKMKLQTKMIGPDQKRKLVEVPKLLCQKDCDRCREKKDKLNAKVLRSALLVLGLVMSNFTIGLGQSAPPNTTFWDDPFNSPMLPLYLVGAMVFVVIILTLAVTVMLYRVLRLFIRKVEEERAAKSGIPYLPEPTWWAKLWQRANAMVPLEGEKSIELDHNYDGIRELDNHLPPWWKGLFYGSIVFAVIYMVLYHFSNALPLAKEEYENEISQAQEKTRILKASQPAEVIDEATLVFSRDEALITDGKRIFTVNNCGSCHRKDGGGNAIGPNLTDNYWLHGGEIKEVFSTIQKGVVEKGMPAWGKVMSSKDVRNVAYYVMSLQGSNPPGAKAPQGNEYKQKLSVSASDTLKVQPSAKK